MPFREAPPSSYTHGTPFHTSHNMWYRVDTYHCETSPELDGGRNRLRCASATDDTPLHHAYDASCACCWLGHGHTQAAHRQLVEAAAMAQRLHQRAAALMAQPEPLI